jgi:hypothetical protein
MAEYTADEVARHVLKKYYDLQKGLFSEKQIKCEAPEYKETKEDVFREIKWTLQSIKDLKELSWTVEQEAPTAKDMFDKAFEKEKDKLATLIRRHKSMKKSEDGEAEEDFEAQADEIWKAEKPKYQNNLPVFDKESGKHKKLSYTHDKENRKVHGTYNGKKFSGDAHPHMAEDSAKAAAGIKKEEVEKCGEMKMTKADDSKLKAFLEKKKSKKAGKMEKMLGMNQAPAANSQPSPSSPSIASQIGWPGTKK